MEQIISKYSHNLNAKTGKVPEEIAMLHILETYGWTYEDYMNTPNTIIQLIYEKNSIDATYQKLNSKK